MAKEHLYKDFTGMRFGRLVAVKRISVSDNRIWLWQCDCGNLKEAAHKGVRDGNTRSCGCIKTEQLVRRNTVHGLSKLYPSTYRTWKDMRARCYNPNNSDYPNYGGRGISVCGRWSEFANFFSDMGERPKGMTIDRIDVDVDYEPSNCRWADAETQANNKRDSVWITIDGETKTLSQWCRVFGIDRSKAAYRHKNGLDPFSKEDFRK